MELSDKAKKWVGKCSFFATGLGFIVAGLYSPEVLPWYVNFSFGVIGFVLAGLGGWFKTPSAP
jgi:hypothetical protein